MTMFLKVSGPNHSKRPIIGGLTKFE